MDDQTDREPVENCQSPPLMQSQNLYDRKLLIDDAYRSCLDFSTDSDSNKKISSSVKYFDYQRMPADQGNLSSGLTEREKADCENATLLTNVQNDNYVAIGQYKYTDQKSESDNTVYLNTRFASICEHFNVLRTTVDNANVRHKNVKDSMNQTVNLFHGYFSNMYDDVENLLRLVNTKLLMVKDELFILEDKYSLDLLHWKNSTAKLTDEINSLKSENATWHLNNTRFSDKEKDDTFNPNHSFDQELILRGDRNALLIDENKLMNFEYNKIKLENQSLKDEMIATKKCISTQEEKEKDTRKMFKNYEEFIKMYKEKLTDMRLQLNQQKEKENKLNSEVLDFTQEIKLCKSTIASLQDEVKTKDVLISDLKKEIDDLKENLVKTTTKLEELSTDFSLKNVWFGREKVRLECQNKEYLERINEYTLNFTKFKTEIEQLKEENMKLRNSRSCAEQTINLLAADEIIEVLSDGEEKNVIDITSDNEETDVIKTECNDVGTNKSNNWKDLNVSVACTSSATRREKSGCSHGKRNFTPAKPVNKTLLKRLKAATDNPAA